MTGPTVRPVKIRITGDDDAAALIAQTLAEHLPALTGGRCQTGPLSAPYANRRDPGVRYYCDVYVVDDQDRQPDGDT